MFRIYILPFVLMLLATGAAQGLEYPFQAGTQVIFDATSVGMGQPAMAIRYELWLLGEREPGKFEAIWVFFNNPRKPEESLAGALLLTIDKYGAKIFPREREVTYILQEAVETFIPDLTQVNAFDKVWKGPPVVTGRYFSYQPLGEENGLVRCSFAQYGEDKMDQIVGVLTSGEAFFDPKANWLKEIRLATTQQTQQGPMIVSNATARLTRVVQKDEQWAAKRREEARAFFVALQQHDDLLFKANDDLSSATITLAPLEQMWQTYLTANQTSIFAALAKNHMQVMKAELPVLQGLWASRKKIVGSGAPSWTLKDPQGTSYSLAQAGQQPVLMVFWSRMSWESLMAIRELKAMKAEYEPRGLLVYPINLDATDKDAIDSLAVLDANMVTLRNTDPNLLSMYGIPIGVLPAAVILDRQHKIADVRYGWGKRVFKELRTRIEAALQP